MLTLATMICGAVITLLVARETSILLWQQNNLTVVNSVSVCNQTCTQSSIMTQVPINHQTAFCNFMWLYYNQTSYWMLTCVHGFT